MNTNHSLTEGNRENGGYRFLAGSRILCFLRCLLFASYPQSNSSPPSCALVSISGFDFVSLRRKTRLRGITVRIHTIEAPMVSRKAAKALRFEPELRSFDVPVLFASLA